MMIIRDAQLEVFERALRERYLRELLQVLRAEDHPRLEPLTDASALALLDGMVERAEDHGVTDGWDVRRFVEYMLTWGGDFDGVDWVAVILRDAGASGTEKLDRIEQEGIRRTLAEAAAR
jgi:hypothetical protein